MDRRSFIKGLFAVAALAAVPVRFTQKKYNEYFGDGSDGNVYIGENQTVELKRDMYFNNLDMGKNSKLQTNGYRVYVRNTLNIGENCWVVHGS